MSDSDAVTTASWVEANESLDHIDDHCEWFRQVTALLGRRSRGEAAPDELPESARKAYARIARREADPTLPAVIFRTRLGLSVAETNVVWLLVGVAIDDQIRSQIASRDVEGRLDPTIDQLRRVVYGDRASPKTVRELGPDGTLRRLGVIERSDGGTGNVHESRQTWAISRRVLAWLQGDTELDSELARIARVPGQTRAVDELALPANVLAEARAALRSPRAVIVATGAPGTGRRSVLAATTLEVGVDVLEIECKRLATEPLPLARQLRMIARECKLLARTPLFCNVDTLVQDKDVSRLELVGELTADLDTQVLVTCGAQRVQLRWERSVIALAVKAPSSAQRAALWRALIPDASETDGEHLATQYPLAPALMHHAAAATKARAIGRKVTPADIEAGIRAVLDDRLGSFATRVEVTQTWDDLVLPEDQQRSVAELIARIRQRRTVYEEWGFAAKVGKGLGVSALFSGPPGTGKTMVAALIARELGLELYQVDTAKLVSKWIGETERHLGELFDAAEAGHAILLFDEADSMFGKRTEVRSSNDRYANLETNYLLQRLESFTGICLLTSNHETNIDPAFQRRLSLHLRFAMPDVDEREHLWRAMLPESAPVVAGVDFVELARRFEMSGGYIRNAALRAAFLAADEGAHIGYAHLEHAANLEYEGMGKIAASIGAHLPARVVCRS